MKLDKLRTCVVCGNKYKYCRNCSAYSYLEPWHSTYDKDECRQIFDICSRFGGNSITADEAKKKLEEIGLPNTLTDGIRKAVDRIYTQAADTKIEEISIEETKVIDEPEVLENQDVEPIKNEAVEEEKSTPDDDTQIFNVKKFRKRKRNVNVD